MGTTVVCTAMARTLMLAILWSFDLHRGKKGKITKRALTLTLLTVN